MALLSKELEKSTVVSVGHRPELEAFHSRKIILEHRPGGAKLVSDVYLIPKPSGLLDRLLSGGLGQPQSRDNRRDEAGP
jgi:putative ATP-binding cassette transporter